MPSNPNTVKRLLFQTLFFVFSFPGLAQMDVNNFGKLQFGIMYDRTNFTGLYTLTNNATGEVLTNQTDYIQSLNAEIKHINSGESGIATVNTEGIFYLLGRVASLGTKNELFNDWDSYLDPLTAGDLHNVKLFSGPNYNEVARATNNHLFDGTFSWAFKKRGAFCMGFNIGFRLLGFPPRYTGYATEKPANYNMSCAINGTVKLLYGLNVAYRKSLGDKMALFVIAGVNTGLNKSGNDASTAIQLLYSPFFNPTLFIGGKYGAYVGLYWEYMRGKDQDIRFTKKQPIGTPEVQETKVNQISTTQLQIKAGFTIPFFGWQ